jgi:L-asparagine oxygenase
MNQEVARRVASSGYAFVPGKANDGEIQLFEGLPQPLSFPGVPAVTRLRPREASSAPPNTYSGIFGVGAFPLHTDMARWSNPPRYLAMQCITGSAEVPSFVLDSTLLFESDEDLVKLGGVIVRPRRPVGGQRPLFRVRELAPPRFRYDSRFLEPASPKSAGQLERLAQRIEASVPESFHLERPGDLLLLDNWRVLHGRGEVSKNASCREIARAYFSELGHDSNRPH